ncbi:serine/threonine protein kinase [Mucilaginibacter glaciei]|uniref:Serine/threonine protein kinase n=1 Tax=Mucilaginibacter glaciei TaxID=2772109 RepID=A0A926NN57_9SPHI|nr:serine/threonine-protein kinase [Mucilaginibacter glaciei]MBD1391535.1 serine/threonine protein kinase [Mucilaginibacter glaciei]
MSKVFTITEGLENLGALRTGGQGSVYKGRRMGPILTAIKLLPTPIHTESEEDKNFRSFRNEVTKLQKVNEQPNPNVVKILSWGITDSGSFPFIEMEYIDGPDLCELLHAPHDKIFTLKEVIRVADQLAGALAHCHNVGIKHGDIKSNNVKYNIHTGNYVLLDFGLAIMTEEQRRTSIRHAGAIEFMAPEQHEGKMLLQTDIYSYGVILYELLTGEVPFPLKNGGDAGRNSVMLAHIENEVPDLVRARKLALPETWEAKKIKQEMQVPQWLLQVIAKCLQKKPEDRYASGMELDAAIINGSLSSSDSKSQEAGLNAIALQSENEKLKTELLKYQQAPAQSIVSAPLEDESRVSLSKPFYYTVLTLLVLFMGMAVYSTFYKRQANPNKVNQDSLQSVRDTSAVPPNYGSAQGLGDNAAEMDTIKPKRDSIRAEKKPVVKPDSTENTIPDTTVKPDQ